MTTLKIFKASAGSGKTYTLAREYIKELLKRGQADAYRHILAVTFTKDATGEMKDRILAELYGLAFDTDDSQTFCDNIFNDLQAENAEIDRPEIRKRAKRALEQIINDYSHLYITTIDSFFQKILRNLARELGKGSGLNIELNTEKIRLDAVNSMVEHANENPQLLTWLTTYVEKKLEENGNWRFKNEVYDFSRCIYNEFFQIHEKALRQQLSENPQLIDELNKQHRKIVGECRTHLKNIAQQAFTLIAEKNLQAEDFFRKGGFALWEKLAANRKADITASMMEFAANPEKWAKKGDKIRFSEIVDLAENQLCGLLDETIQTIWRRNTSQLILSNIHQLGLTWNIATEIENGNRENNRFMLSDTAQFLNDMIDGSDAPFIYEKTGAEIRNMLIDEFQDTSLLQWQNFRILLDNLLASNNFNLLVGDVKQSIYRWRNGDWRILNGIESIYEAKAKTLEHNYRSQEVVVEFNNSFFVEAGKLLDEKYSSELTALAESPFPSIYGEQGVCQKPVKQGGAGFVSIDIIGAGEEMKYSEAVLMRLLEQLQTLREAGIAASDVCILTRRNSEIKTIAAFLASVRGENPDLATGNYLNIVSNEAFQLSSSTSVRIIIETLKAVANPENPVFRIEREPPEFLKNMPLLEMIFYIYRHYDLGKNEGQSAYLFCFFDEAMNYLRDNTADIHAFIEYWDDELQFKTIPTGEGIDGIRAMTVHKSKGLQFHTVILPYCTWDLGQRSGSTLWCGRKEGVYDLELLPVSFSSTMENTVFERDFQAESALSWLDSLNLLYVAFTRAEQNLIVFGKEKKTLKTPADIRTVSHLMQWIFPDLHYENGALANIKKEENPARSNPLKMKPEALFVDFVSEEFQEGKPVFRQSNKSREFFDAEVADRGKYIAHGNVMHALFARIVQYSDIERAVESLIYEGSILASEKDFYIEKVKTAISASGVEDWFSDKYRVYPEFSILIEENGEVTTKRPDRVLLSDTETIIIDYKFGEPHAAHRRQMEQYSALLRQMQYPGVKAFLWYVERSAVE
jgi:ATP-dependent exoDNAse (exonuclease V) beta subunit